MDQPPHPGCSCRKIFHAFAGFRPTSAVRTENGTTESFTVQAEVTFPSATRIQACRFDTAAAGVRIEAERGKESHLLEHLHIDIAPAKRKEV